MRKLLFFLFLALPIFAQNSRYDSVALGPRGPIPNATVAVCTQPANTTTTPCSPLATLCSSLTDATCISPNPVTADFLGNYHFYVKTSQGPVTVQLYGPQVAAPVVLPDQSIPVTATGFVKCLNNICFADQFAGADIGAKVNAAIASLPTVSGYATGTIYLTGFSPSATQSTKVTISSPFLSIIGPGSGALQITCTLNDNCWDVHISPFVIYPGLVLKGFSVIGQGITNASAVGLHIGDVVGAKIEDLAIDNFRGANSACVWVDNINGFFERNTLQHINAGLAQTSQQGCTKAWRFTNTATTLASSSFGHNHFIHNKLSVAGGQTGISIESGAVYDSTFDFTGNAINGATAIMLAIAGTTYSGGGGTQLDGAISFPVECTAPCSAGTLISSGAGTSITIRSGIGFYDSSGLLSTTGTGNLTRDLNSGLNNAAIPESIQIKASPGSGAGLSYFIIPQPPVSTRSITISDPGGTDTFAWLSATQTFSNKSTAAGPLTGTVASGTATMTTAAIVAGNCGTTVTVAATGVATTDTITWAFNAAPAGSNAGLVAWPTANNVNFAYCPNTAETPAAATINWRVIR